MILIALGANLPSRFGEPEKTLEAAVAELEKRGIRVLKSSKIMINEPVPPSGQPMFRNSMISVATDLPVGEVFKILKAIERDFGRADAERNAARVIDIDIIAYDDLVLNEPELTIPHPRMQERDFVLVPLSEVAPGWKHPVLQKSVNELISDLRPRAGFVPRETKS